MKAFNCLVSLLDLRCPLVVEALDFGSMTFDHPFDFRVLGKPLLLQVLAAALEFFDPNEEVKLLSFEQKF